MLSAPLTFSLEPACKLVATLLFRWLAHWPYQQLWGRYVWLFRVRPVHQVTGTNNYCVMAGLRRFNRTVFSCWWFGLAAIEKWAVLVSSCLSPYAAKFTPVKYIHQAWLYGLVLGCFAGFSFTALIMALSSALQGGLAMLAFGLRDLAKTLLLMGVLLSFYKKYHVTSGRDVCWCECYMMGFFWQLYLAIVVLLNDLWFRKSASRGWEKDKCSAIFHIQ